jgi:hypothetical protein
MVGCSAIWVKFSSVASVIHGRKAWQFPQRGVPSAVAGVRLSCPQFVHRIVRVVVVVAIAGHT